MTMATIKAVVSEHYRLPVRVLEGPLRWGDYVWPRQVAMYLCRELLAKSYQQIGDTFGHRDQSTAKHAVQRVQLRLETDEDMRSTLAGLIVSVTAANLRSTPSALHNEAQAA